MQHFQRQIIAGRRLYTAATLALVFSLAIFIGTAFAATYLGSGHFPSPNINRAYSNTPGYSGYADPIQAAVGEWTYESDLNIYRNDSDWDGLTNVNWWNTTWAGHAYICSTNNSCDNSTAWNGTYAWCSARANHKYQSNYSASQRRGAMSHELGHCWSLHHRSDSTSIMGPNDCSCLTGPNNNDNYYVNQRH